jgi:putative phosphoribosyl transferase
MDIHPSPFKDRRDAGRQLGAALMHLKVAHPLVLALPRGGVPVAYEVAQALDAPLDVLLVRKIGAPGFPELGLGAVVDGERPRCVMNQSVLEQVRPSPEYIEAEVQHQVGEIERRRKLYRGDRSPAHLQGRTVIVVDDGIATGGTMKIALTALSQAGVGRLVFAVPVAPPEVLPGIHALADEGVCLRSPRHFRAVSPYYEDFEQTTDEDVIALLDASPGAPAPIASHEENPMHAISEVMTPDVAAVSPPPDDPKWLPSSPS